MYYLLHRLHLPAGRVIGCLSVYRSVCLFVHVSVSLSVFLSFCCLSTCLSACLCLIVTTKS